jgi:ATP/maltotriose-dependent transcriptional regulator MalT
MPRRVLPLKHAGHTLQTAAAAFACQALRLLNGDQLRSASLLLALVEAELGRGNGDAAAEAAERLQKLAEASEVPAVAAQAALGFGRTALARGEKELAVDHFETGLEALPGDSWPLLRAALHLELARAHTSKAHAEAIVNAQAALGIYARIGAPEASTAGELLRAHGVAVTMSPPPPTPFGVLSPREREVLALLAHGMSNPAIASRLCVTAKTAEHHVSNVLTKLSLRNRAEAAAFAASFELTQEARRSVPSLRR